MEQEPSNGAGSVDQLFGFFSFTEVTEPDQHRAYNEWHQLDHLPEQYSLPFVRFGQRWVSTPACQEARTANEAPFDRVHYVTMYLMAGEPDLVLPSFLALGQELRAADRFFRPRRSHLAGPFDISRRVVAPTVELSPHVLPFRPNRGIYLSLSAEPSRQRHDDDAVVSQLLQRPGVAGVWEFDAHAQEVSDRWDGGPWHIIMAFLDDDPLTVTPELDPIVGAEGPNGAALAGPFMTIQPWQWDWFD